MADHARTQARDVAAAALAGLATTGANVFTGRPESRPLQDSELPALIVYTNDTDAEAETLGRGTRRMVEITQLVCKGFVRGTGDVDKTLDTIEKEVRAALAANPTLSGKAKEVTFSGSTKEHDPEAEQPTWAIEIRFQMEYHVREDLPDAALP